MLSSASWLASSGTFSKAQRTVVGKFTSYVANVLVTEGHSPRGTPAIRPFFAQEGPRQRAARGRSIEGTSFPFYVGVDKHALLTYATDDVVLQNSLQTLKKLNGITGIAVDVYWGLVEGAGPGVYDWSGYKQLLHSIISMGFKVKVKLCFNSTEGIPLPAWVLQLGESDPHIFYTDKAGTRSMECLSLGVDEVPMLLGRTGQEVYRDLMCSFRKEFESWLGPAITSVLIGLGPNGELKYPSHPSDPRLWEYPGHGEFQCYDPSMLATLKACAELAEPLWGLGGPHDAGEYNEWPQQCAFFAQKGNWCSSYGRFFLQWYSEMLTSHAVCVMGAAATAFAGCPVRLSARIPSCHWWSEIDSHAAELTAGYYNTAERNGYFLPLQALSQFGCNLHLGIAEAGAVEGNVSRCSNPEKVLLVQRAVAAALHMPVLVETAGLRLDDESLARMEEAIFKPIASYGIDLPPVTGLVMYSMCDEMFEPQTWQRFGDFVHKISTRYEEEAARAALPKYDALVDGDNSITSSQAEVSRLQRVQAKTRS